MTSRARARSTPLCARSSAYFSRELLAQLRRRGVHDVHAGEVDALGGRQLPDVGLVAQDGEVADVPAVQNLGGPQDPHVVPLRQDDVPALQPGPLDEVVQEPQRRHPLQPRQVQPLHQLRLVHALGPQAQGRGHLAAVPGPDLAAHLGDPLGGGVGVVRGGEHGERRLRQQRVDVGVRGQAAGEDQRRRHRELRRERRRQARDHHVGTVTRDDHQRAVVEHVQEVGHVHGRHLDRTDVAFHVLPAGHLADPEGRGHLAGGGPGDVLQLREDVHGTAGRAGLHGRDDRRPRPPGRRGSP